MKEFIEKLIGRLEEYKNLDVCEYKCSECKEKYPNDDCPTEKRALDKAIEIVNQLAEEYKPTTNLNIQEVIDNLEVYTVGRLKNARVHITVEELQNQIDRLEQLAEEYKQNTDQDLMIVESLPSLYPMMQPFEEEAIHRVVERAKYNNGWIPCSERLPNKEGKYLVTVKNLTGYWIMENDIFVCEYQFEEFIFQGWEDNKVIAWQPLPDPYIPKQEEQKG